MLGELKSDGRIVVCDLEAGVSQVIRSGHADVVLVVAEPTAKSIEVARRARSTAAGTARVVVVANRVRDDSDIEAIRAGVGDCQVVVVPEEPSIARADEEGVAPIDAAADAPGVRALIDLARSLDGAGGR